MINLAHDIDDPTPLLSFHVRQPSLGHQEGALDKKIDHPLVEFPVVLLNRQSRLVTGGVGNQDIRHPQLLFRLAKQPVHLLGRGGIGLDQAGRDARLLVLGKGLPGACRIAGEIDRNRGTRLSKGQANRLAQAGAVSGDDGNVSLD